MTYPLGVDVGTTYTAAALWRDGRVQTAPLGNRANAVPSVAYLREDGTLLVGEAASRRGIAEPDRAAREFKRRMGDDVPILLGGRGFAAHELTGHVLRWVVEKVSELQGGPPSHIVLTYPAEWGDYRRGLYVEAARTAGFRGVGLLAEPVAAATWYAAQERVEPGSLIGIYDFGGGTFDASVVRKTPTGMEIYGEPGGDDSIGGVDFDHALYRFVASSAGVDLSQLEVGDRSVAAALAQLLASVVDAKEALSADTEAIVPVMLPGQATQVLVTRADLESLIRPQVLGTVDVFGRVVRRAGVDPAALHTVLLVGGTSRIPLVRQLLAAELGIRVAVDAHPKYTVCLGAAIAAAPRVAGLGAQPVRPPAGGMSVPAAGGTGWPPQPAVRPGPSPTGQAPSEPASTDPAVAERVDLAKTGLTAPTDVPVEVPRVPIVVSPPATPDQAVMRTRDRHSGSGLARGRLAALGVLALILAVLAAIVVMVLRNGGSGSPPASNPSTGNDGSVTSFAGQIRLTGGLVAAPDGADAMRAITALPNGDRVAVGVSLQLQPRAWVLRGGGPPAPAEVPADQQGTLADVAGTTKGAVAVGWTGTGPARRPAVWVSPNGATWRLLSPTGDFAAGTGLAELTAVTAVKDGFVAAGVDRKADPTDGDIALFRSVDGLSWSRMQTTGLNGPGPQAAQRLAVTSGGQLIAVGSALNGARRGPVIWTSTDGAGWQLSPFAPDGSPTLWAIAARPEGTLLTCGSVGSADHPTVGCWTQQDQQPWQPFSVTPEAGSPTPRYLYGLLATGDELTAVGVGQANSTVDAATWAARLG